jgi:hypothetical protein
MTPEQFIEWLTRYLDQCEKDQISLIREKLNLVQSNNIGYNYWSSVNLNKASIAGEKLSWSIDNTNGTYSTNHIDTFTDSEPHK